MKITNVILCALTWDSVFQGISDPRFHSKLPGYTTGKETYGHAGSGWGLLTVTHCFLRSDISPKG